MIAPEWVAVSSFGRRRSLSDLAVWGFPETFPENLPPQALLPPFPPLFLLLDPFLQFFFPSNASLQLSSSDLYQPLLPSYPPFFLKPLPTLSSPLWTSSEHLRNPSVGSPKRPKRPFLGHFGSFPPKPQKGLKYPFLGPF